MGVPGRSMGRLGWRFACLPATAIVRQRTSTSSLYEAEAAHVHTTLAHVCVRIHSSQLHITPTMASSQVPGILITIRFGWSQLDEVEIPHVSQVPMQFTLYINGHRISTVVASSTAVPSRFPTGLLTSSF